MSKVKKKTRGKKNIKKRYTKKIRSNKRSKGSKRRGSKRRGSKKPTKKGPKKKMSNKVQGKKVQGKRVKGKKVRRKRVTMERIRAGAKLGDRDEDLSNASDLSLGDDDDDWMGVVRRGHGAAGHTLQQPEILSRITQHFEDKKGKGKSLANLSRVSKGFKDPMVSSKLELKRKYIKENKKMFLESLPLYEPFVEMKKNKDKYDGLIEFYLNPDKKNTALDPEFEVLSPVEQELKEEIENVERVGPVDDYDPIAPWADLYTLAERDAYWDAELPDYRVSKIKYDETKGRPLMFLEFIDLPNLKHLNLTGHFIRPMNNEHGADTSFRRVLEPLSKLTTCEELVISVDPRSHHSSDRITLDLTPIKEMTNLQKFTLEIPEKLTEQPGETPTGRHTVKPEFTNEYQLKEMKLVFKEPRHIWDPHDDTMEFKRVN